MIKSKLFTKTILTIIVLFGVLSWTTALSSGWNLYTVLIQEYESKGTAIARSVAGSTVEILLNRDVSMIQATIDQFTEIAGVSYVFVVDSQNEIISHTFVPAIPEEILKVTETEDQNPVRDVVIGGKDYIDISSPIVAGAVGHVHVGMDKGVIKAQIRNAIARQMVAILAVFLVSVAVAYVLVNKISQPLNKLAEYGRKLAARDFSATVEIKYEDEVGLLARTMQSMAGDLRKAFEGYEQAIQEATAELQETLAYLTNIIDNMADGLLATDATGKITRVNPTLTDMLGLRESDMIGKKCEEVLSPELGELEKRSRKHPDKTLTLETGISRGRTGKAVATSIHKSPLSPDGHEQKSMGSIILIRDITAEKETDRMKTDFISTVSHELRTPMTSVLGYTAITRKKLEDLVFPHVAHRDRKTDRTMRQVVQNLGIVISEGERLTTLINDLLDISKMEAGQLEWKMQPLSVYDIVDTAMDSTSALFEQKGLTTAKDLEEGLPQLVGDRDRLVQVMVNLLSNAVKFTEEGGVTCRVSRSGGEVTVSVIDTGIGIARTEQENIFKKFKQVGDTLTDRPKGTGLGLPISKQIVEHHGGRIWVESVIGEGSTFSFTIPLASTTNDGSDRSVATEEREGDSAATLAA
ncbi:MAG: ATP-binding protein [Chloroflexota bacterium]